MVHLARFGMLAGGRSWARQETADGFTQILFGGDRAPAGARSEPAGNGTRAGR
jgi:hypothetical protein